jgi:hypothetical protein
MVTYIITLHLLLRKYRNRARNYSLPVPVQATKRECSVEAFQFFTTYTYFIVIFYCRCHIIITDTFIEGKLYTDFD